MKLFSFVSIQDGFYIIEPDTLLCAGHSFDGSTWNWKNFACQGKVLICIFSAYGFLFFSWSFFPPIYGIKCLLKFVGKHVINTSDIVGFHVRFRGWSSLATVFVSNISLKNIK